jgi:hypothetical protein
MMMDCEMAAAILSSETNRRVHSVSEDPYRFITGGGDIEHSYFYAEARRGTGDLLDEDPYYELYRELTRDIMFELGTAHSNCILSFDVEKPHRIVQEFYGQAAEKPQPELCCPVRHESEDVRHIPTEVLE